MKKIFLCFILMFSIGLCFACDNNDDDDDDIGNKGQDITNEEIISNVKSLIQQTVYLYKNSSTGSINFLLEKNNDSKIINLDYNFDDNGNINEFGIHYKNIFLNDDEKETQTESYLYVKNNKVYESVNGSEIVEDLDDYSTSLVLDKINPTLLLDDVFPFYEEDEFYETLNYVETNDNVYEFSFDIINYHGSIIKVDNMNSIKFYVKVINDELVYAKLVSDSINADSTVYVEFKGLVAPIIEFPNNVI